MSSSPPWIILSISTTSFSLALCGSPAFVRSGLAGKLWSIKGLCSAGARSTSSGSLPRGNRPACLAIRTGGCCDGYPYLAAEETDRLSLEDLIARSCFGNRLPAFSALLLGPFVGWQDAKSLVPKSVTTPVALGIVREGSSGRAPQDQLVESLLAVGIMISALSGAVFGPLVLQLTGVRDRRAVGLALGCASIAVGTARAFEIDSTAGAFASVGMNLTAICAGFVMPWLLHLI